MNLNGQKNNKKCISEAKEKKMIYLDKGIMTYAWSAKGKN